METIIGMYRVLKGYVRWTSSTPPLEFFHKINTYRLNARWCSRFKLCIWTPPLWALDMLQTCFTAWIYCREEAGLSTHDKRLVSRFRLYVDCPAFLMNPTSNFRNRAGIVSNETWIQTSVGLSVTWFSFFFACGSYGHTTCYYSECEDCNTPYSA